MKTFYITEDQTTPALDAVCIDENGAIVNLGGCSVSFTLLRLGGAVIFSRAATIVDAATGHVRYTWQAGDTSTAGRYLGRFVVLFPSLDVINFPSDRYLRIEVN